MKSERMIDLLKQRIEQAESLTYSTGANPAFTKWQRDTEITLERIFGPDSRNIQDFKAVRYSLMAFSNTTPDSAFRDAWYDGMRNSLAILQSMIEEIQEFGGDIDEGAPEVESPSQLNLIEQICLRFHRVYRQLQARHGGRPTLTIADEYDVQDLLHALLKMHFDDIRAEEWSPSYAGKGSRIDFLLRQEEIVVEVKKTRPSLSAGDLGAELIVDIARYERHPSCKTLVCFVYDPDGKIGNPIGLERDLESHSGGLKVRVIVAPKE